ncbi:hypothetical protein [Streptomyces rhizosphaericola]|uniref:hypothetical protein n=1 Tax=Streptomyces rhizosphaericola TaxID=2564098 RepID=UPI003B8A655F
MRNSTEQPPGQQDSTDERRFRPCEVPSSPRRVSATGTGRLLRSPTLGAHLRLIAACLPAGALAYAAARAAEGAGDVAAAGAGTLVLLLTVVLLARPLRIAELTAMVDAGRARLRR